MTTTILETCNVAPPPETVSELALPLTFQDLTWLHFHPTRRLMFYEFPSSKHHFLHTIVPTLKHSLSIALKHYVPLAANLLYPLNVDLSKPLIRYLAGDYVPVTISVCDKDFDYLTAYHARGSNEFYDFVPKWPPVKEEIEYKLSPVLVLQVTLFPGRGFCIGVANHHVLCDASSIFAFLKAWSSINKFGGDVNIESLPIFDKSVIKDRLGLDSIFWNRLKMVPLQEDTFPLPTEHVSATFVLEPDQIKKMKDMVMSKNPGLGYVSSFVIGTAYAWMCIAKSGEEVERDGYFIFAADIRARVTPPVPSNYFGNCLGYGWVKIDQKSLVGEEGFVLAASAMSDEIKNRVNKKDELTKDIENWEDYGLFFVKVMESSPLGISGSHRFDFYGVDFGWGKTKKVEVVNTNSGNMYSMSLNKSRDFERGLEFGFSLPEEQMNKFAATFVDGLKFFG